MAASQPGPPLRGEMLLFYGLMIRLAMLLAQQLHKPLFIRFQGSQFFVRLARQKNMTAPTSVTRSARDKFLKFSERVNLAA